MAGFKGLFRNLGRVSRLRSGRRRRRGFSGLSGGREAALVRRAVSSGIDRMRPSVSDLFAPEAIPPWFSAEVPSEALWIEFLTTDPVFLPGPDRGDCEAFAVWFPFGRTPPWKEVASRVGELFDRRARDLGIDETLHLDAGICSKVGEGSWTATPGFGHRNFLRGMEGSAASSCDRRRILRRRGRPVPASWTARFGELAPTLWESGASSARAAEDLAWRGGWAEAMLAMRSVLLDRGALGFVRIPGWFESNPWAMDDPDKSRFALENPVVASWRIASAASGRAVGRSEGSL